MLCSDLLVSVVRLNRSGHSRPEVADLGNDVEHAVSPDLFSPIVSFMAQVHIDLPVIRIPSDLPVEVQAAQHFKPDIEPEASRAYAGGAGVPAAFFDQRAGACDVVHAL